MFFFFEGVRAEESKTIAGDEVITVAKHFVYLNIRGNVLVANEFLVLENGSDATIVGTEEKKVLSFTLPEGFFAPQFMPEIVESVAVNDRGFDYTKPVSPGELQVGVSYHLKVSSFPHTLSIRTSYPTRSFIIVTEMDNQVVSDQLATQPPMQQDDKQFRLYTGENLDKGAIITAKLTSSVDQPGSGNGNQQAQRGTMPPPQIPPEGRPEDNQKQGWIVLTIVSILILGGVFTYYIKRELNRQKKMSQSSRTPRLSPKQEREELIKMIGDLDDQFEAGELSEDTYRKERARKKKRLVELTRALVA